MSERLKESMALAAFIAAVFMFVYVLITGVDKHFDGLCKDKNFSAKNQDLCPVKE